MKYIGKPQPVFDAVAKVTGEARYTDDLAFPNPLHAAVLTSPHAHARILSIDVSEAEALPGVAAAVTHLDAPETVYCRNMRRIHDPGPAAERVFNDVVRYAGDKVAAVAAETEEIARQALKLIRVEYEVLPAVFDPEEALQPGAYPIYPGGNLVKSSVTQCGDVDAALAGAEHVIEHDTKTAMIHHGAIEPHLCVAYWSREDDLFVWEPQRAPFRMQIMLSKIFGVPYSKVHVHGQIIGGTFGSKEGVMLEPVALMLSRKTGRYVKIRYNRKECITSTFTRHSMKMYSRLGVTADGVITAFDMNAYQQAGAYAGDSLTVLVGMSGKFFKLYAIPNMRLNGLPAYTNTPLGGAMRGYGSPNIFMGIEAAVEHAARTLGMDPVEFRMKNLMNPYDTDPVSGHSLGNGRVKDCLRIGAELFQWQQRRAQCEELSHARYAYGCGVAVGVDTAVPDLDNVACIVFNRAEQGYIVGLPYSVGIFNLGAEGQIIAGAFAAALAGTYLTGLPAALHILLTLLAAGVAGMLISSFIAGLRLKFNASETVVAIMMNSILMYLGEYAINYPFKDATDAPKTIAILETAVLAKHAPTDSYSPAIYIALACSVLAWLFLNKTVLGFEAKAAGYNPHASRYKGVNIGALSLLGMALGGLFAGLGGAGEVMGLQHCYYHGHVTNMGYTGVGVALVARKNPLAVIPSAFLFAALRVGGMMLDRLTNIPSHFIWILQGTMIIFLAIPEVSKKIKDLFAKIPPLFVKKTHKGETGNA